jgi:FAD-dependent urate hydroxylase
LSITPRPDRPVIVIGAGPHGLAAVAHLRAAGVPTLAFGETLGFWHHTMPDGMWLRSSPRASHISSPGGQLALSRWADEQDQKLGKIVTIEQFRAYGSWFQARAVPDLDPRLVTNVERADGGFAVSLSDGEQLLASRVVVAAGLGPFAYVPPVFEGLPPSLASHASASPDLERFAGRSVAVVGAGQSALESAALLEEAGADVEILGRTSSIFWLGNWSDGGGNDEESIVPSQHPGDTWRARRGLFWRPAPTDVGGRLSSWVGAAPDVMRLLPRRVRTPLTYHCIRPAGAFWLPDRMRSANFALGRTVVRAEEREGRALLRLDDGSERSVEHVLLGTGYAIDVRRYPFLSSGVLADLHTVAGSPVLRKGLESSVAGLHFTGAPAAESFGPVMRFVVGTAYTAPALTQHLLGRRRPVFRWAF